MGRIERIDDDQRLNASRVDERLHHSVDLIFAGLQIEDVRQSTGGRVQWDRLHNRALSESDALGHKRPIHFEPALGIVVGRLEELPGEGEIDDLDAMREGDRVDILLPHECLQNRSVRGTLRHADRGNARRRCRIANVEHVDVRRTGRDELQAGADHHGRIAIVHFGLELSADVDRLSGHRGTRDLDRSSVGIARQIVDGHEAVDCLRLLPRNERIAAEDRDRRRFEFVFGIAERRRIDRGERKGAVGERSRRRISHGIRIAVDDRRCEMEFVDSAEIETARWLNRDRCDRNARRDVVQIGNRVWKAVRVKADAGENERRILRPAIRALRELHAVEDVDDRLGEDDLRQDIERHTELVRLRHELLRDPVGSHALQAHAVAAAFRDNEERRFRYHRRAGLERIHDSRFDRILSGCRRRVRVGDDEIHQRRFAERLIVSLDLKLFAVDGRARDFTRRAALELESDYQSGVGCGDSIDIHALQIVRQPHHPNVDFG